MIVHVGVFRTTGLCAIALDPTKAVGGSWEFIQKNKAINCAVCQLLITVVKANKLEYLLKTQQHTLVQMIREVMQ